MVGLEIEDGMNEGPVGDGAVRDSVVIGTSKLCVISGMHNTLNNNKCTRRREWPMYGVGCLSG